MTRPIFLWSNIILMGTILTLASVLVGDPRGGYGFPFAWKTGGCPPPGITITEPCLLAIGRDWLSFGLDVLIYIFIGYAVLLAYSKYRARKKFAGIR